MEDFKKPKFHNAVEIGALKPAEAIATPERFRATLSFDFVFGLKNGKPHPYCIEFNGDDSGIAGSQKIKGLDSTQRIVTGLRAKRDLYALTKNRNMIAIAKDIESGEFPITDENRNKVLQFLLTEYNKKIRLFPHAYKNENWIQTLASNKVLQPSFIPEANRVKQLQATEEDQESSTGYWVIKPSKGLAGQGISIASNTEIKEIIEQQPDIWDNYVIQEYVESIGAKEAGQEMSDHAASLRLLTDFRYLEDDQIDISFLFAYQRVGQLPKDVSAHDDTREQSTIINLYTGAHAYKASPEETAAAMAVANEIIHNLAEFHKELYPD